MAQIACLGILVADVVGKPIEAFPAKGTLGIVERMELHAGGCAANTGIALAKLDADVAVLGKVGQDGFGDFLAATMEKSGVNTRGVKRSQTEATSATMVAVEADGERTFLHSYGANVDYTEADVDWEIIDAASILHIAGPFLMPHFIGLECATVLKRAKECGKITTLDTVWDPTGRWMSVLEPSLPYLDYALPSLEEARRLTGYETPRDIAQVFLDKGVQVVGLKLGAEGAYLRSMSGDEIMMPPFAVPVMDALGAGDAWAAGFLCGITHGWDWEKSLRFANAAGACCVQSLGATSGIRSFADTSALAFGDAESSTAEGHSA